MAFFVLRRSTDPPPSDDEGTWVFVNQHAGEALSVWLGLLHIQIYRDGRRPYVGWEDQPPRAWQGLKRRIPR